MELKLIKKIVKVEDKETKENRLYTNFYIVINGNKISIKPSFKQDYQTLKLLAENDN